MFDRHQVGHAGRMSGQSVRRGDLRRNGCVHVDGRRDLKIDGGVGVGNSRRPSDAQASGGNCGRKRTGRGTAVRMIIRRQGGGVAGRIDTSWYHVHFQTTTFARLSAEHTSISVVFRNAAGRGQVQKDGTLSKLGRPNLRRDYAHTTVRVQPGSTLRFRGHVNFYPSGIPLAGNRYLTGEGFPASCVAR